MKTYDNDVYWGQKSQLHPETACEGNFCPFHNPSAHHMVDWPKNVRLDPFANPLTERICPHVIGHPDPDSLAWLKRSRGPKDASSWGIHGCDGCCSGNLIEKLT